MFGPSSLPAPILANFSARLDRRASQPLFQHCTFVHHKQQGGECTSYCRPSVGTTPVGPLSPLFLDLRPTSILSKKNTHPYTNLWDGRPPSSARVPGLSGGEWTKYIGLPSSSIQILDHFSMYRNLNNWDRYRQAVKLSLIGILLLEKKRLEAL